jgi:hypothetical protein
MMAAAASKAGQVGRVSAQGACKRRANYLKPKEISRLQKSF